MNFDIKSIQDMLAKGVSEEELAESFTTALNIASDNYAAAELRKRQEKEALEKKKQEEANRKKQKNKDAEFVLNFLKHYYPTLVEKDDTVDDLLKLFDIIAGLSSEFNGYISAFNKILNL